MNDFNKLAPIYDVLARLVFKGGLNRASAFHLDTIPAASRVLILGGGSGHCLLSLDRCAVDFVEKSSRMIALAKRRPQNSMVSFQHTDFQTFEVKEPYDFVLCPFFLDVFHEDTLLRVIDKIKSSMTNDGRLIVTDFLETGQAHHRLLLKLMFSFFHIFAKLESRELIDFSKVLQENGLCPEAQYLSGNGFITSQVFTKIKR